MNINNLDGILKNKLGNFEVSPLSDSFEAVTHKLARLQKRKRKRAIIWFFVGVAVVSSSLILLTKVDNVAKNKTISSSKLHKTNARELKKFEKNSSNNNSKILNSSNDYIVGNESAKSESNINHINSTTASTHKLPSTVDNNSPNSILSYVPTKIIEQEIPNKQMAIAAIVVDTLNLSNNEQTNLSSFTNKVSDVKEEFVFLNPLPIAMVPLNDSSKIINSPPTTNSLEKELLQLKTLQYKPIFYIGLSYQPVLANYKFEKSKEQNIYSTGYNSSFNSEYLNTRIKNSNYKLQAIPGLKFGVILKKQFILGATFGYYNLKHNEIIFIPANDSSKTLSNSTFVPLSTQSAGTRASSSYAFDALKTDYINKFSYIYASLDIAWIIKTKYLQFFPSLNIGYNRVTKSSYILFDKNGYNYFEKSTLFLNQSVYTLTFKVGFSKTVYRNIDLQLSPIFAFSPSSVFEKNYFITQKYRALGLEGALIYKFRFNNR